jgi:NAD(P)-dependent dehydrogenase (short-subunit alcohol dehydrogenase family)
MTAPPVRDLLNLSAHVVAVTGASSGVGSGIARRFAEAGADVVVHFHHGESGAAQVAADIESMGRRSVTVGADLRTVDGAERLVQAAEALGKLDTLVNNAGTYPLHGMLDLAVDEWQDVIDTNLRSVFLCTQAVARRMIGQAGGVIVNIASIEAQNPAPAHSHYAAAKAGIIMFTRNAALELGPYGIRVNSVSPGLIWREGIEEQWPEGVERWQSRAPLGRLGRPDDVADACLFLASPAARWITGVNLVVDGGVLTNQVY